MQWYQWNAVFDDSTTERRHCFSRRVLSFFSFFLLRRRRQASKSNDNSVKVKTDKNQYCPRYVDPFDYFTKSIVFEYDIISTNTLLKPSVSGIPDFKNIVTAGPPHRITKSSFSTEWNTLYTRAVGFHHGIYKGIYKNSENTCDIRWWILRASRYGTHTVLTTTTTTTTTIGEKRKRVDWKVPNFDWSNVCIIRSISTPRYRVSRGNNNGRITYKKNFRFTNIIFVSSYRRLVGRNQSVLDTLPCTSSLGEPQLYL